MSDFLDKLNAELEKAKIPVDIKEKPKRGRPKKKGVSKKWTELSPEEQARRISMCSTAAERGLLVRDVRRQLEADGLAKTPDTLKLARKIVADTEKRHMQKLIPEELTKAETHNLKKDIKERTKELDRQLAANERSAEEESPWDFSMVSEPPAPLKLKPEPVRPKVTAEPPEPVELPEPEPRCVAAAIAPTVQRRTLNLFSGSGYSNASVF